LTALLLAVALSAGAQNAEEPRTWYVAVTAPDGGDGSAERPFRRLAEAEAASRPGDVLALRGDGGDGAWREALRLQAGQRVIGSDGARLRPLADAGIQLASGVEVSGLAVEAAAGAGVVGRDVEGVRLRDLVVRDSLGPGILLERATDVELAAVAVEGSAGTGVVAHAVRDLRLVDSRIERAGDEDGEDALRLVDPVGEVRLVRCRLSTGREDLVDLHVSRGEASLVVEDSELTSPGPGAHANDAIHVRLTGGTARLTVDGSRFRGIAGNAVDAAGESADGTLSVVVRDSSFADSAGSALSLSAGEDGSLDFAVRDSSFARLGGAALELAADDRGRLTGTAAGNRIEEAGSGAVVAFADESTTVRLTLLENRLGDGVGEAISLFASGAASVDLRLAGNDLGGGLATLEAAGESRLCLDLTAATEARIQLGGEAPARVEVAAGTERVINRAAATAALLARLPAATVEWGGEPGLRAVLDCGFTSQDEVSTGR
jgi:hypothetical protein